MVFITIMTRGAAGFFRFVRKNPSGRTKTPVVSYFADPSKMDRRTSCQRFFDSSRHKETTCGNLGGSVWSILKL